MKKRKQSPYRGSWINAQHVSFFPGQGVNQYTGMQGHTATWCCWGPCFSYACNHSSWAWCGPVGERAETGRAGCQHQHSLTSLQWLWGFKLQASCCSEAGFSPISHTAETLVVLNCPWIQVLNNQVSVTSGGLRLTFSESNQFTHETKRRFLYKRLQQN